MSCKYRNSIVALLAGLLLALPLVAADFPRRDITVIVPFNAGGGFDTYVRALAPGVERGLGGDINVLPRNRPGAGGRRGASDIFRARADGYTIGIFNLPGVLIPQLQGMRIGYDLDEVTWLATLGYDPYAFVVAADSPYRRIADLQQLERPALFGATGPGSTSYVATSIVNDKLGIDYQMVTGYKGSSDYLVGLIRGDVDAVMINMSTVRSYLEAGDVRALAVFGTDSDDPAVQDAADLGVPDLGKLRVVRAIGAPPGLPADVRDVLERALLDATNDAGFQRWLKETGNDVMPAGAAETAANVADMSAFYNRYKQLLQ